MLGGNLDKYTRNDVKSYPFTITYYYVECKQCGKVIRGDSLRRLVYAVKMHYKRVHNSDVEVDV